MISLLRRALNASFAVLFCSFAQAQNTPPTISAISNQTIAANSQLAVSFTVADAETSPKALVATGSSSNTNLVPDANISFGGTGSNRTATIRPLMNGSGRSAISIFVADTAGSTSTQTFELNVEAFSAAVTLRAGNFGSGSLAWADHDNDSDLDLLIVQEFAGTSVFRNDGTNGFIVGITGLRSARHAAIEWGDYNNDSFLDLLLNGYGSGPVPQLYRNEGGTNLATVASPFPWNQNGTLAWGDPDNDGDLDLLLAAGPWGLPLTQLYQNHRAGANFVESAPGLRHVNSFAAWLDYDSDGWSDILLAGSATNQNGSAVIPTLVLYRNDRRGGFTPVEAGLPQEGTRDSVAIADYDNDGDPDIAISGARTRVFRNSSGFFAPLEESFPRVGEFEGGIGWADYDSDGWLDLVITHTFQNFTEFFRNTGAGFETEPVLTHRWTSTAVWGDYDGDGDLDIAATEGPVTTLFRNNLVASNQPPRPPLVLSTMVFPNDVVLSWTCGSDAETPSAGLTYNLRVGRTPGGNEIISSHSSPAGFRRLPEAGNVGSRREKIVRNLSRGTYYWSAQSVDSGFAGSAFAAEATFTITNSLLPNFDPIPDVELPEDSRPQIAALTNIFEGEVHPLSFAVCTDSPALLTNLTVTYTTSQPTGRVSFALVTNAFGAGLIFVTASGFARDGELLSFTRSFRVTVTPVNNDSPVALPQAIELNEDSSVEFELHGYDPDGDSISSYTIASQPGGSLSGSPPFLRYTPVTNYFGADSFTFGVTANGATGYGTISFSIRPVTDVTNVWMTISRYPTNRPVITLYGEPYQVYQLQTSTTLSNWFNSGTARADFNGIAYYDVPLSRQRFFRARTE